MRNFLQRTLWVMVAVTVTKGTVFLPPEMSKEAPKARLRFSHGKLFFQRTDLGLDTRLDGVDELYFTQVLDHFNPHDHRKWEQRYFMSSQFYKPPHGPVFLIIDGEGTSDPRRLVGNWFHNTLAEKWGAMLFSVEHRFYGKSRPTEDASTKNLKYLSSRQALKDLEAFVASMKSLHNLKHNKWVSWGGSYPGNLSAWLRLKYPHTVDVAVAISAPVHLQPNYEGYFDTVVDSLFAKHSQACVDAIRDATGEINALVNGGKDEWKRLMQLFSFCEPMGKTPLNVQQIYAALAYGPAGVVQYNEDQIGPEMVGLLNVNIPDVCDIMTNHNHTHTESRRLRLSPIERYAALLEFLYEKIYGGAVECSDSRYETMIKDLQQDQWSNNSVSSGYRQWVYQTCTEFGYFQTSTWGKGDIFGYFPVDFYYQQCQDTFGHDKKFVESSIERTNEYYGGIHGLRHSSNIIFTNGLIDPWHAAGILRSEQTSDKNKVILISDTAHCADIYKASPGDSIPLQVALMEIESTLAEYLGLLESHGHHTRNISAKML